MRSTNTSNTSKGEKSCETDTFSFSDSLLLSSRAFTNFVLNFRLLVYSFLLRSELRARSKNARLSETVSTAERFLHFINAMKREREELSRYEVNRRRRRSKLKVRTHARTPARSHTDNQTSCCFCLQGFWSMFSLSWPRQVTCWRTRCNWFQRSRKRRKRTGA